MREAITLATAFAGGLALGFIYFGALWWTVKKSVQARQPVGFLLVSFILRAAVVMAGFYFVTGGHWARIVLVLLGFLTMRFILIRRIRPRAGKKEVDILGLNS